MGVSFAEPTEGEGLAFPNIAKSRQAGARIAEI
jgi:hypothetical protein